METDDNVRLLVELQTAMLAELRIQTELLKKIMEKP